MIEETDESVIKQLSELNLENESFSSFESIVQEERVAPVGKAEDDLSIFQKDESRLRELEEEQERLNNSLILLSTHFAQVQFRLQQISQADRKDRDDLLKELQEFAFKGCADVDGVASHQTLFHNNDSSVGENIQKQKERQMELITRLKDQLEDLEKFAYETGEGGLPSSEIIARQKAVIDKLHEKVQLNLQLDKMSQADIQKQVDDALKQLINPMRAKEQLVEQLQTQIIDLERFVSFLQGDTEDQSPKSFSSSQIIPNKKNSFFNLIGYGTKKFERNELKSTEIGNHYGDVRARLELAVSDTVSVLDKYVLLSIENDDGRKETISPSIACLDEVFEWSEEEVVSSVRKVFCPALRALLEHGMNSTVIQRDHSFVTFGCIPARSTRSTFTKNKGSSVKLEHIWNIIIYYYESKLGQDISDIPVRRLSQSFQLGAVGGRTITSKQILLSTIENILTTHNKLKRSNDAMWKAFVSAALNEKKLPAWLRIIFRTRQIVQQCFANWSYVARTGCEDLYTLLESLHKYYFNLPVDLAIRPFRQMKDAF